MSSIESTDETDWIHSEGGEEEIALHEILFAQTLGVDIDEDYAPQLISLAAIAMHILPNDWELILSESELELGGIPYFYNKVSQTSSWGHPYEDFFKEIVIEKRLELIGQAVPVNYLESKIGIEKLLNQSVLTHQESFKKTQESSQNIGEKLSGPSTPKIITAVVGTTDLGLKNVISELVQQFKGEFEHRFYLNSADTSAAGTPKRAVSEGTLSRLQTLSHDSYAASSIGHENTTINGSHDDSSRFYHGSESYRDEPPTRSYSGTYSDTYTGTGSYTGAGNYSNSNTGSVVYDNDSQSMFGGSRQSFDRNIEVLPIESIVSTPFKADKELFEGIKTVQSKESLSTSLKKLTDLQPALSHSQSQQKLTPKRSAQDILDQAISSLADGDDMSLNFDDMDNSMLSEAQSKTLSHVSLLEDQELGDRDVLVPVSVHRVNFLEEQNQVFKYSRDNSLGSQLCNSVTDEVNPTNPAIAVTTSESLPKAALVVPPPIAIPVASKPILPIDTHRQEIEKINLLIMLNRGIDRSANKFLFDPQYISASPIATRSLPASLSSFMSTQGGLRGSEHLPYQIKNAEALAALRVKTKYIDRLRHLQEPAPFPAHSPKYVKHPSRPRSSQSMSPTPLKTSSKSPSSESNRNKSIRSSEGTKKRLEESSLNTTNIQSDTTQEMQKRKNQLTQAEGCNLLGSSLLAGDENPLDDRMSMSNQSSTKVKFSPLHEKWYRLGAYEMHCDALASRHIIVKCVRADSLGTILIDPAETAISLKKVDSLSRKDGLSSTRPHRMTGHLTPMNNYFSADIITNQSEEMSLATNGSIASEIKPSAVTGRMINQSGTSKVFIRRDLGRMQWVIETDSAEIYQIMQRKRKVREINKLADMFDNRTLPPRNKSTGKKALLDRSTESAQTVLLPKIITANDLSKSASRTFGHFARVLQDQKKEAVERHTLQFQLQLNKLDKKSCKGKSQGISKSNSCIISSDPSTPTPLLRNESNRSDADSPKMLSRSNSRLNTKKSSTLKETLRNIYDN